MFNRHIRSAARVSRTAATKAALRELGHGAYALLYLMDGSVVEGQIADIGFRTVWLIEWSNGVSIGHARRYESIAHVGGI